MDSCLFCKIIAGEIPATFLYEDQTTIIINDIAPQAPDHFLAIPRTHFASIHDVPPSQGALLGDLLFSISKFIKIQGLDKIGYRLVINSGEKSGQSVFHIHVHILSGREMHWPPG